MFLCSSQIFWQETAISKRILDKLYGIGLQIAQTNRLIERRHVVVDVSFWKNTEEEITKN